MMPASEERKKERKGKLFVGMRREWRREDDGELDLNVKTFTRRGKISY